MSKRTRRGEREQAPTLPFDVTQDIDPALAEPLRRGNDPTLTQTEFDDIEIVLPPPPPKPRAGK